MSDFRHFKLINSVGAEYDLCDTRHLFLYPDGLGFERDFSSLQTGDSFVSIENNLRQQKITGEMLFLDYNEYSAFTGFIANNDKQLVIAYKPAGFTTWYYRTCTVSLLKKGEISTSTNRLHCNVDFLCFSQWYESIIAERTINQVSENSVFPLTFPFVFSDKDINEVLINNTNPLPAPCKIEIVGPCSNPRWNLINNGIVVANGEVDVSLNEGEHLIVDANIESMRIVKVCNGVEVDAYQYSNFATDRFIYAPPNGKSLLRFQHDSNEALDITVEVKKVSDTV